MKHRQSLSPDEKRALDERRRARQREREEREAEAEQQGEPGPSSAELPAGSVDLWPERKERRTQEQVKRKNENYCKNLQRRRDKGEQLTQSQLWRLAQFEDSAEEDASPVSVSPCTQKEEEP